MGMPWRPEIWFVGVIYREKANDGIARPLPGGQESQGQAGTFTINCWKEMDYNVIDEFLGKQ